MNQALKMALSKNQESMKKNMCQSGGKNLYIKNVFMIYCTWSKTLVEEVNKNDTSG